MEALRSFCSGYASFMSLLLTPLLCGVCLVLGMRVSFGGIIYGGD